MFTGHLCEARLNEDSAIKSFDVTSNSINVSADAALQATSDLLVEQKRQTRDTAMGQSLAVAVMSKVQEPVLERKPPLYYRYIYDCCITSQERIASVNVANHNVHSNGYPAQS
ncbi:hypothetical protein RB195_009440 [Necator americanus]|uniref:Uncharacterized protein n=1 Tax=Necator americanus TaxID=51031 RepID=A0ABR1CUX6_NECAM